MKKLLYLIVVLCASNSLLAQQQLAGNDMETWRLVVPYFTFHLKVPAGPGAGYVWKGLDTMALRLTETMGHNFMRYPLLQPDTTLSHSGSSSAKLLTTDQWIHGQSGRSFVAGLLTTANVDTLYYDSPASDTPIIKLSGGVPVTSRIGSVTAWIMYDPGQGNDSGIFYAEAIKTGIGASGSDSIIGSGKIIIQQKITTFTELGFNIVYNDFTTVPDLLRIVFRSAYPKANGGQSNMWVDDVTLSDHPVDIAMHGTKSKQVLCTPNPAASKLYISNAQNVEGTLKIYGTDGRVVLTQPFTANTIVDISRLANGLYYYQMSNSKNELVQQDRFVVAH